MKVVKCYLFSRLSVEHYLFDCDKFEEERKELEESVEDVLSSSDLYKSDWKLQGNTNTQLKLLCRASYTGK